VKSPQQCLIDAAETQRERNAKYAGKVAVHTTWVDPNSAYLKYGEIMQVLMRGQPNQQHWAVEDWQRFGIFTMMVSKMIRYAANFGDAGHQDSAHDLVVYSAMLESLTP
jgi:hypothetical protein